MITNFIKRSAVPFLLVISLLLTGCYPNGDPKDDPGIENFSDPTGGTQIISPDKLSAKYESDKFTADIKFPEDIPEQVFSIKLKPCFWDNEKLREIFIGNENITSETNYTANGFPDEKRLVVYFGDNKRLIYEPMNISFECNDEISSVQSAIAGHIEANFLEQFTDKELQGFSSSDALSRVQKILDELGITNIGKPVIRSVTAEKGNELMKGTRFSDKEGNEHTPPKLSGNDEFYFITYPLVYNNIELSQHLKMNSDLKKSHSPSYISAVVSKDKLAEFKCSRIYEPQPETAENIPISCTANDALNVLIKHYTETFQMNSVTLTGCKLVYITTNVFEGQCREFTPVWQFYGCEISDEEQKKGSKPERLHYDYVLPETGEIYEELF